MDELRESQKEKLQEALDMGELEIGGGLNKELGLGRVGDTRWGSLYRSFENFMFLSDSIFDVLDTLVEDSKFNSRFNEVTSDLFHGGACLNPVDSFSSFDIRKIVRMAKLYLDDFDKFNLSVLENQLTNYIVDVRDIGQRFSNIGGLGELPKKLVEVDV
uniref:Uncharacterized protein n=1 Tax=Nicotiana tabacum TaxID=4097 RepID=A0A1S4C2Q2_TOBAC|nr:PREDICTED: uncharacterized protein LOC107814519 [Nicotiana tabacum]